MYVQRPLIDGWAGKVQRVTIDKHIGKNQMVGDESQGGVRLSKEGGDKVIQHECCREREKDNQAKVETSLGVFCQVALGVNDMKEFISFYLMEQENYSAMCVLAIYSVIINIYVLIHGIIN